jgi:hypothetical protein
MNLRLGAVSGACIALLAGFSPCLAAKPSHKGSPAAADSTKKGSHAAKEPAHKESPANTRPAGIGGLVGGAQLFADTDYSNRRTPSGEYGSRDSKPRFAFAANFRYAMTPWLRWQVSPGFFWAAYDQDSPLPFQDPNHPEETTKENVLTMILPVSAQLQWTPTRGPWHYHVGAGPGVYRVWVENHRKVIKDPVTKVNHKGFYPGVSGQIGVERFLKAQPSTSMEFSIASHWAFADRPEQFPSGFNSAVLGVEVRVGANYYFDTRRFERKRTEAAPAAK